ncbi:CBS domain-containing protein [Chlamydiota bacterium]
MEIILTHSNADFDAFASMVAVKKLYPYAKIVSLGSEEQKVKEFIRKHRDLLGIVAKDQVDPNEVSKIVLVDTSNSARLEKFDQLASSGSIPVHIYDHHPKASHDLEGTYTLRKPYGATTTILVELLKKKGLFISSFEATLFALGIYEDTTLLRAASTREEDLQAVGYLLSYGADLPTLSHYLNKELDEKQVRLLTKLLEGLDCYRIQGVPVYIATASIDERVRDISLVVHKLRDIENAPVLFAIINMEHRIHCIARSRLIFVDVGKLLTHFGGGGHLNAASVTLKNKTIVQVREELLHKLREVQIPTTVAEIMNQRHISIGPSTSVKTAFELFKKHKVAQIPVVQKSEFLGMLLRDDIIKAVNMNLLIDKCRSLIRKDVLTIDKTREIESIKHYFFEQDMVVPVLEQSRLAGTVSQREILHYFHEDFIEQVESNRLMPVDRAGMHSQDVSRTLRSVLGESILLLLKDIGMLATKMGAQAYVVGGFVRDILLGHESFDLDIVIEEIGILFAKQFAEMNKGKCIVYEKFSTAVVVLPSGQKVDIATARIETYNKPGALPEVKLSSIKHDLYRRDFTINAMAIQLNQDQFGRLIDFFGGGRDLKEGILRVLHNVSFIEDPTRIFRAVRFEQRLGFTIDKQTQMLIKKAVKMDIFGKVSYERIRDEIILMLDEPKPMKAIRRMAEFDELRFIHPAIKLSKKREIIFDRIEKYVTWFNISFPKEKLFSWLVYFIALIDGLKLDQIREVCEKFCLRKKFAYEIFDGERRLRMRSSRIDQLKNMRPSQIVHFLDEMPLEIILFILSKVDDSLCREKIIAYLTEYRFILCTLTGNILKKMGLKQGPVYATIIQTIRSKKLDGVIATAEEEIAMAKTLVARSKRSI